MPLVTCGHAALRKALVMARTGSRAIIVVGMAGEMADVVQAV